MNKPVAKTRRDRDKTKAKLLQVAIAEFSAKGYSGVAVDDIVKKAGFNKRMVYHYFGSKKELYRAAILEVYSRLETIENDIVTHSNDPVEKLSELFESYFQFNAENPEFSRILLWENLNEGMAIEGNERILRKDPFLKNFREIIKEGIDAGIFRPNLNIRHLLINFIALCFIYYSNTYTLSQSLEMDLTDPKVLGTARKEALELFFQGIKTETSAK